MVEAAPVRRLLCAGTQYLTQTAQDFSLPHPVATTLTNVVDDIGRTDPATLRFSAPRRLLFPAMSRQAIEERLLPATATTCTVAHG